MTAPGAEPIPAHLGGGVLMPGPYGCLHLIGPAWSWWECPTCAAADTHLRTLKKVTA